MGREPTAAVGAEVFSDGSAGRPRRLARTAAIIVGITLAGLVLLLARSDGEGATTATSPLVGRLAPAIDATDTAGAAFRIDDYRGRWVLVNFFATWCAPCRLEHPELVEFERRHAAAKDASVVSVSFNDEPAAVREFFDRNGGDWPVVAEGNAKIAIDYGVVRLPESYLISPTGMVVHKFSGGVRADEVDRRIAEARADVGGGGRSGPGRGADGGSGGS